MHSYSNLSKTGFEVIKGYEVKHEHVYVLCILIVLLGKERLVKDNCISVEGGGMDGQTKSNR